MTPRESCIGQRLWNRGWEPESYFIPRGFSNRFDQDTVYGDTYSDHGGYRSGEFELRDEWEIWDWDNNHRIHRKQKLEMRKYQAHITGVIQGGRAV